MVRKTITLALLVTLALSAQAVAGDSHEDMMKSMMNCSICSKMVPHLAELGPVMKGEVVELNNGMAVIHTITDAKKVDDFHMVSKSMQEMGGECMAYTDEQAKEKMCAHCDGMRNVIKAGASFSIGLTETGDMMVLTSDNPELQTKIAELQAMFEMMVASH